MTHASTRTFVRTTALSLVLCAGTGAALGADLGGETKGVAPAPSGWTYQFTPYGWLPWIDGDATVKGRKFDVEVTPIDVLESLHFTWMSYQQAKRGPVTLFSDIMYADLGTGASFFRSARFAPDIHASVGAALSADYQYWTVEAGGMYEISKWQSGSGTVGADKVPLYTAVELLAGGRYWYQQLDIDLSLAGTLDVRGLVISGNRAIATSGAVQWVDPFIGARVRHQVAPGEEIQIRGDVGGFGAGSQFSWQAMATYNWLLCVQNGMTIDGYLGYRALSVDYQQGEGVNKYVFDAIQQGPVTGITVRF